MGPRFASVVLGFLWAGCLDPLIGPHEPAGADIVAVTDLDGDARADAVAIGRASTGVAGRVFVGTARPDGQFRWGWSSDLRLVLPDSVVRFGDVNGDGRPDLVVLGGESTDDAGRIMIGLSDGDRFQAWTWKSPGRLLDAGDWLDLDDVNGDGRSDLVSIGARESSAAGTVVVRLSDGVGFGLGSWSSGHRMVDDGASAWLADVNGDGRADLVSVGAEAGPAAGWGLVGLSDGAGFIHWSWASEQRLIPAGARIWLADVDGDGRSDLVTQSVGVTAAGWMLMSLSDGRGFPHWSWSSEPRMLEDDATAWVVDLDHDGHADLISQGGESGDTAGWVRVGRWTGAGFERWSWASGRRLADAASASWFADVDGDGRLDFITQSHEGRHDVHVGKGDGVAFAQWSFSWSW